MIAQFSQNQDKLLKMNVTDDKMGSNFQSSLQKGGLSVFPAALEEEKVAMSTPAN